MIPIGQVLVLAASFFVRFEIVLWDDVHAHAVHYRHHAPRVYLAKLDRGHAGLDLDSIGLYAHADEAVFGLTETGEEVRLVKAEGHRRADHVAGVRLMNHDPNVPVARSARRAVVVERVPANQDIFNAVRASQRARSTCSACSIPSAHFWRARMVFYSLKQRFQRPWLILFRVFSDERTARGPALDSTPCNVPRPRPD